MIDQNVLKDLTRFRRQYLQLVEPSQLKWLEGNVIKASEVQAWIFDHLFSADHNATLPPDRYRLRVLKVLISKLEKAIDDPEEDVWFSSMSCFLAVPTIADARTAIPFCNRR